ncbi:MAG: sugar transferase [Kaiparowitsia implicata GSE-PSE-MK54-09C]|nr:sugar transferase [Kaiparowitsia implicata GSE-PSE-MK54-09C]
MTNATASSVPLSNRITPSGLSTHPSTQCKIKRLIDILGALIGLGITAVVLGPIAIALCLDSPGPVFYSQVRCGLNGRPFRMWKFRSMVVGADKLQRLMKNEAKGHIFKNRNDPRVTRVGRWLRRTSLDELPQCWNVLQGQMSLVGTRPPTLDEVADYAPHHAQRLLVKPGMTGEWQVNGRSGIADFEQIVQMDLDYQAKWSIGYDLMLIFRTVEIVFNRNGAY